MKAVLLLRNEAEDTFGLVPAALEAEDAPTATLDAWDAGAAWPEVTELSGLIVFGGSMNCDQVDAHPFLARVRALLREAHDADLPVLGVCLGAQLLVRALELPVGRAPRRELGFPTIEVTPEGLADPVLGALPRRARMFQWHEDAFALPPGAELLARGQDGGLQAFRLGSSWAVQFHPEVTADELDGWFASSGPSVRSVWGREPADLRAEVARRLPRANRLGEQLFRRFGRQVRARSERAA